MSSVFTYFVEFHLFRHFFYFVHLETDINLPLFINHIALRPHAPFFYIILSPTLAMLPAPAMHPARHAFDLIQTLSLIDKWGSWLVP